MSTKWLPRLPPQRLPPHSFRTFTMGGGGGGGGGISDSCNTGNESYTDKSLKTGVKITGPPGETITPRSIVTVDIHAKDSSLFNVHVCQI